MLSGTIHFGIKLKAGSPSEAHRLLSFERSGWIDCIGYVQKPTHQRNRTRSLFRKDRRSIFLTTAKKEGMRRWVWQASITVSWLIQSSYSGSDPINYPLPSLVQDTMRCCLEYIFISDPVFECELATNLLPWKLVSYANINWETENASTPATTGSMKDSKRT